jgi:hypothetical protein
MRLFLFYETFLLFENPSVDNSFDFFSTKRCYLHNSQIKKIWNDRQAEEKMSLKK